MFKLVSVQATTVKFVNRLPATSVELLEEGGSWLIRVQFFVQIISTEITINSLIIGYDAYSQDS